MGPIDFSPLQEPISLLFLGFFVDSSAIVNLKGGLHISRHCFTRLSLVAENFPLLPLVGVWVMYSVADYPFEPASDALLSYLPHQLANQTKAFSRTHSAGFLCNRSYPIHIGKTIFFSKLR